MHAKREVWYNIFTPFFLDRETVKFFYVLLLNLEPFSSIIAEIRLKEIRLIGLPLGDVVARAVGLLDHENVSWNQIYLYLNINEILVLCLIWFFCDINFVKIHMCRDQ